MYPPAQRGGYEVLCAETVNRLRDEHDVTVLTSRVDGLPSEPGIVRELDYLRAGRRSMLRAPQATLRAARVTHRLLEETRPDLVFVWNGAAIPHAAIRVAEESGAAIAYMVCEYWFERLYSADSFMRGLCSRPGSRGAWGLVMRAFNRHPLLRLDVERRTPASIAWVSGALRNLVELPATVEPVVERVIYTGVHDPEVWSETERRPQVEPPVIAFIGRLEWQKGPDVAYRAIAALRDEHGIEARLVLAGRTEPSMGQVLNRLAKKLRIEDRVERLGQVDRAEVARLLAGASVAVVPSSWEEPSGGVCLEAALARVPVVASRSGGMPDGLREEREALYFPIGDHDACASALARVLREREETAARVARAFDRAHEFTFDSYMPQVSEFLEAAVDAGVRSAGVVVEAAP